MENESDERKARAEKAKKKRAAKEKKRADRDAPVLGNCALCRKHGELVESHIIPEFFYTALYDDKGRAMVLSTHPERKHPPLQNGIKEHLLCAYCDNVQFSRYEDYTARAFTLITEAVEKEKRGTTYIKNAKYTPLKLFFMSLLWRMGISTRGMFRTINLGEHEEKLRLALLAETPLAPTDYPVCVRAIFLQGEFLKQFTCELPPPIDVPNAISFAVQGFRFDMFTTLPAGAKESALLSLDGNLPIFRTNVEDESLLEAYILWQYANHEKKKNPSQK